MAYPTIFYSATNPLFFETLDRYEPTKELFNIVEARCSGWRLERGGFWSTCVPRTYEFNVQGWKLHVAGTPHTAADLLQRLVPILAEEDVAFKFCSDLAMVRLSTSKNWARTGAGKFVTIYPLNARQFVRVADRCYQVTRDLAGPYILTDRPYQNSRVIFYRYGGHLAVLRAEPEGLQVPVIFDPDGKEYPDRRVPFFQLPPWVEDAFSHPQPKPDEKSPATVIGNGRYAINRAIRFSSCGGIYEATDKKTGAPVIAREQRPLIGNWDTTLEKAARILQRLAGSGVAPAFVDLFREGEHFFLIEEYVPADSLWTRMMSFGFGQGTPPTPADLLKSIRETIRKIVDALEIVHEHNIVLRDLTKTNVLLTPRDEGVKFIDFELAYETDRADPPIIGSTIGYGSPQQVSNELPKLWDDYYALGALLIDTIAVTASGLGLNRQGILRSLRRTVDDFGLPAILCDVAQGLLEPDPLYRLKPRQAMSMLDSAHVPAASRTLDPQVLPDFVQCPPRNPPDGRLMEDINETQKEIRRYILATADYARRDRLWPSSLEVFLTNPLGIRFGAAGVAYYLFRSSQTVPEPVLEWILGGLDSTCYPAGLYNGISGVALLFLSLGRVREAKKLFERSTGGEQIFRVPGLYDGAAGWGLVNLHFWSATGEESYLDRALQAANHLLRTAKTDGAGAFWPIGNRIPHGLGSGASGIALFLTYLGVLRKSGEFIDLASRAVGFDLANASWLGSRVFMHEFKTNDPKKAKSPHTKYGSAGVATAALRLYSVTGDTKFRQFAESCAYTVSSRGTNKLWQDWGLAGFGELLIDAYSILGDRNYLNTAYYLAEALLGFRVPQPEGIAFPGEELLRISCDYGLGSAGIGIFLQRLQNPDSSRFLLLDELILRARGGKAESRHQEGVEANKETVH